VWLLLALVSLTGCSRAEPSGRPPADPPGAVPTFDGVPRSHIVTAPPLRIDPGPDAMALFHRVMDCYPTPSWFRGELTAEVRTGSRNVSTYDGTTTTSGSGGALVLRVPLYSTQEAEREREREAQRRMKVAQSVGQFVESLVSHRLAERELELLKGIEARSRARVAAGVADTAEQIKALRDVAALEMKRVELLAKIVTARVELVGLCQADKADSLNTYLLRFNASEPGHRADEVQ
jgi:outer membrane protein TolC